MQLKSLAIHACAAALVAALFAIAFLLKPYVRPGVAIAEGAVAPQLVSPVPGLLSGANVAADANSLATGGTITQAIDADGASRLLLRVAADSSGQSFVFQVINDQGNPSVSTGDDRSLDAIGTGRPGQSRVTVASIDTSSGPMAFVVYRSPSDFLRPGFSGDANRNTRTVTIRWRVDGSGSASVLVTILRPSGNGIEK